MTTTENPESLVNRIIAELDARPEVKPTLLRALLTDEFLLLPAKVDRLMELIPAVENLQQDVSGLKEGYARLEEDVSELKAGQARLEEDVSELKAGQARLEEDVSELKAGQARLEEGYARLTEDVSELKEGQARLEERQDRLEDGQARLERGQQRMGGQLSNLIGSQYQRRVTEIGYRLVRREWGIHDVRILHADLFFGARMADQISEAAEVEGRITPAESDELILSDIILAGVDEANRQVQVLLEVSLTVQQHDVERAEARARILEKATGIRTLAGVVGENIPEEERTRAQGRGVACFTVKSG